MGRREGDREGQMKREGNEVMREKKRRRRGGEKVTYGRWGLFCILNYRMCILCHSVCLHTIPAE